MSSTHTTFTTTGRLLAAVLLSTSLLSGCVSRILESKNDAPQIFVLKTGTVNAATVAYPVQLSVALPSASPGLDTNRIAALTGNHLDYFSGARWGGTAPQVVQQFLIDTLQATQGFNNVTAEGAQISVNQLLDVQLKDFQAEYRNANTAPTIKVTLIGTLIQVSNRTAAAPITASASVVAADNRLNAVVLAYQSALQQAAGALATQVSTRANELR